MKHLSTLIVSLVVVAMMLFGGCDANSIMQEDTPPLPNSQVQNTTNLSSNRAYHLKSKVIKGQYIVIFKNQFDHSISQTIAQKANRLTDQVLFSYGIPKDSLLATYQHAIKGFAAKLSKSTVTTLKKDPRIKSVTHNAVLKPPYLQYYGEKDQSTRQATSNGQIIPWGVSRVNGPFDGTGKEAWIIGTGIDLDNTDLNVDLTNSASFIANETAQDNIGHGTYVAGLLAAKNNNEAIVGVAAGAEVVAVKVCNDLPPSNPISGCPIYAIINGIDYVSTQANPGDIINISLGLYDPGDIHPGIDEAVIGAADNGLRFVISAGNDRLNASNFSPARVDHANVWTVSAFRQGDQFAAIFQPNNPNPCVEPFGFGYIIAGSDYGNPPVDYSEPGELLKSLLIGGGVGMGFDGRCTASGTSYAAPMLAGLLLAAPQGITTGGTVSNDPDGNPDSIAVGKVPPPPFSVTITGPKRINSQEPGIWTAHPANGSGDYNYQWYYKYNGPNFVADGSNSDTYSKSFTNNTGYLESAIIKVVVTDTDNNDTAQASSLVSVRSAGCPPNHICN